MPQFRLWYQPPSIPGLPAPRRARTIEWVAPDDWTVSKAREEFARRHGCRVIGCLQLVPHVLYPKPSHERPSDPSVPGAQPQPPGQAAAGVRPISLPLL